MPTLRQLKALHLIAQTGSFTRAAERLFVTQSAMSGMIKDLEEEIGVPLVERTPRIRLTEAGRVLEQAAHRATHEVERALATLRDPDSAPQASLRVVAAPLSAASVVPQAMALMRARGSRLRIELLDRPIGMIGPTLLGGEADVGIGSLDAPLHKQPSLHAQLLTRDPLTVATARDSALARSAGRRRSLGWRDLADEELILVGRSGPRWDELLDEQALRRQPVRIGHEVQLLATALALVRSGLGVAMLPAFASRALPQEGFRVFQLADRHEPWNLYAIVRRPAAALPRGAHDEFLEAVLDVTQPERRAAALSSPRP